MSEIPEADKQLIKDLRDLIDRLSKLRTGLYANPRPGCACDGKTICAHHKAVYIRLDQVDDCLVLAIQEVGRVEAS